MCHVPYEYVGFQEQVQMTCILVIIIEYKLWYANESQNCYNNLIRTIWNHWYIVNITGTLKSIEEDTKGIHSFIIDGLAYIDYEQNVLEQWGGVQTKVLTSPVYYIVECTEAPFTLLDQVVCN